VYESLPCACVCVCVYACVLGCKSLFSSCWGVWVSCRHHTYTPHSHHILFVLGCMSLFQRSSKQLWDKLHSYVRHDSFTCVGGMTYSNVWHDAFKSVPRLFRMWQVHNSYVFKVLYAYVLRCYMHMCDILHSHVYHVSSICVIQGGEDP